MSEAANKLEDSTAVFGDLFSRKESFLSSIRSSGRLKYKRCAESPLRYAGGKSLGVGYVAERIPDNTKKLVSPFFGGGSVEISCARHLGIEVIGYDVFDILCNYWKTQISRPEALYKRLQKFSPDRQEFQRVKKKLQEHWEGNKTLDRYDLAAHYYFNSNTSYGPHFLGWPSDIYLQPARYKKMIEKVRDFHPGNLSVFQGSFEDTIARHPNDFLYCDPPYYLEDGKTFVGMYPHRNFPIHHKRFRHELLRDLLLSHKGGFILSYNDCEIIRDWYSDCEMSTPQWQYTFGQGDTRIGENRARLNGGSHIKKSHELLIWRYETNA